MVADIGLKANEWIKAVSEIIGGKGGGKDISAQGTGDKLTEVDNAMKVAKKFASSKFT